MATVLIILLCVSLGIAAAGVLLLLPSKKKKESLPPPGPVSPDSMIQVRPAGPGKLRMSFPQGDRMPLEVMLQIVEVKEETDLDILKDPGRSAREKQEVVDRLRSIGYEIAYDPFPEGRTDVPVHDGKTPEQSATDGVADAPSSLPDSGEGEVDPETLRSVVTPPETPSDERFTDLLRDTEAIFEMEDGTSSPDEDPSPTAEDERRREVAESQGLGGLQMLEPGLQAEEGHDGMKAVALMEFLAEGLRNGSVEPRIARYAEELLNIRIREAPWRDSSRSTLRSEDEFRPLDASILAMDLDEFDIFVRDRASRSVTWEEGRDGRRAVTVADLRRGGPRDLAWDRLDLD